MVEGSQLRNENQFFQNCFYLLAIITLLMISYQYSYTANHTSPSFFPFKLRKRPLKRILVYTAFFGENPWKFLSPVPNFVTTCNCEVYGDCEITYDRNQLNRSDLVIFHGRNMPNLEPIQRKRPLNQLWMYYIMESPHHTPSVQHIDRYFNLTMSYRLNSDVQWLYSWYTRHRKLEKPNDVTLPNYAKGKTKLIAWAVSNCNKIRDQLAKKLNDYGVRIDNYGRCKFSFTNNLSYSGTIPYHKYKFVFGAENSFCQDYITEKYWLTAFEKDRNMVPVVLGGGNYSDPRSAIPGSFIDALSFESPKKLAEYLLLLDKNDTLYNQYFEWQKEWTRGGIPSIWSCNPFACDLCKKVHDNKWNIRKNPLSSEINSRRECHSKEQFFEKEWIKRQ